MKYEAIIWDCDGVLIDSEVLACSERVELLKSLGYTISLEDFLDRFMGKSSAQMFDEIAQECGLQLANAFSREEFYKKRNDIFNQQLRATPGIRDVLCALDVPMAVASGSSAERLQHTLSLTGLADYFNGHIYSSELVAAGKPAPDIFLYAAEKLNVNPRNCLVIEDGIHGIRAANAAGMDVYAYLGGSHMTEKLQKNIMGLKVLKVLFDMRDLLPLLQGQLQRAVG